MNPEEFLKLENQLCFSIYACSREITRLYRPILDELGLTYPQFLTLTVLWKQDQMTVKEIGEQLYLDSGTLTPMLKRMEAMEVVERVRSKEDERRVLIRLTEIGRNLREQALELPEKCIPQFGLTKADYQELLQKMNQLIGNLQQATKKGDEKFA